MHIWHNDHIVLGEVSFPEEGGIGLQFPAVPYRELVEESDALVGELPVRLLHVVRVIQQGAEAGRIPGIAGGADVAGRCKNCLLASAAAGEQRQE